MRDTVTGLTQGQQQGAAAFFEFLMSDAKEFLISGGAGVGKTYLMTHLVRETMKDYEDACRMMGTPALFQELSFTATTNKAAEVLEKSLARPVSTIHSFLALKVQNNYKTGKSFLSKRQDWVQIKKVIVFIDECSMIDTELLAFIDETIVDSKIVYVGDHAQMAPVSEKLSPIYARIAPENQVFLTEPVRNSGSPALMQLCTQLRATVETGKFWQLEADGVNIVWLDEAALEDKLHDLFGNQANTASARALTWTNEAVENFNTFIREEVQGLPMEFKPGDKVVTANTFNQGRTTINVEREFYVLSVMDKVEEFDWSAGEHPPLQYRNIEIASTPNGIGKFVPVPVNKVYWSEIIKELGKRKDWSLFFRMKEGFLDLRFMFAATAYKAQGSTYDEVIIHLGDIGASWDADQVARMLYVSGSRAKSKVYLFRQLPYRYSGGKFDERTLA